VEQQLGDGSSQAANSAVPWQEFSRARWGRLIAAAVICTVLVLLPWLKSEFNGWQALLLWAVASSFMGMALTSAVARQYLDREGLHLRVGKVETYPWDQLAGAERTRAGNYPRLQIALRSDDDEPRTVDVDTFRAPMRQLRRLKEAIERGLVDVQARPTGTAPVRPFPFILVLCGLSLLAGVLIFVPLPGLGSLLGDDEVDQACTTSSATVPNGWVTCRFGHVTVSTPPTWASVTLRAGKLSTRAHLDSDLRKEMVDDLKQPDTLGELVDTESLGWSFRQTFITNIIVSTEEADDSIATSEELARIARDEIYAGPDAPKDVAISTVPDSAVPAVKAQYTDVQDGDKVVVVEYTLSFPGAIVHLDLGTDIHKPGPDIATSDAIVHTVRYAVSTAPVAPSTVPGDQPHGPLRKAKRVYWDQLKTGDCFKGLTDTGWTDTAVSPTRVDCRSPHEEEVTGTFTLPGGSRYPGDVAIDAASDARCKTYFARYVGVDWDSSAYDYDYATPDPSGWRQGDHKAICLADDPNHPTDNTISVRNVKE